MMKRGILLVAFLAPTLAGAQSVAYETRGETLGATLRAIGQRIGKPIEVDGVLANEIVIVRTKSRPVEDVLRQVAGAVGGKLETSNGGWRIAADAEVQTAQEKADFARRLETLRTALAARRKRLDDQPEFGERDARLLVARLQAFEKDRQRDPMAAGTTFSDLWAATPDGRLVTRVLTGVGAEALAAIEPGQRVVFTERPNRLQRPLPPMAAITDRYWAEFKPMADEVAGKELTGFAAIAMPEKRPTRWLLEAKRGPFESGLEVTLKGYDDGGIVRTRVPTDLTVSRLFRGSPPTPSAAEKPFAFSPGVKRILAEMAKGFLGGQSDVYLPEDVRKPLRDPVANDPLSWWVADALFALAAREDRDLVACVPDLVLLPTLMMAAMEFEAPRAGAFETYLAGEAATLTRPEGWLLVSPRSFRWSRELRTDRRILKVYLEAVARGGATFIETAQFVYGAPRAFSDSIAPYYLLIVAPESMEALSSINDHSLLRIVGSLSPVQLASAGSGTIVPIGAFSPETRKEVESYVFGPYAQEPTHLPDPVPAASGLGFAADEPTVRYANGLSPTLSLAVAPYGTSFVLRALEEGGAPPPRDWEEPANLHRRLATKTEADLARFRFMVGERTTVTVALHYEPGLATSATFRLVRIQSAEPRPFAGLPEAVRRALLGGTPLRS
ncbi:MAG: hypothetical protein KIS66_04360 [Fimbriimonadaceae bacterium]|nr:hypothetical protein [Fimbriimonadaceae bacterium]